MQSDTVVELKGNQSDAADMPENAKNVEILPSAGCSFDIHPTDALTLLL